jgi:hypothetical protein
MLRIGLWLAQAEKLWVEMVERVEMFLAGTQFWRRRKK